ncbi:hypothetical protein ES703_03800 [subsurface metagenome]
MHVLLVEPPYYTRYPPLGLLKLATYHKMLGDTVEHIRGYAPAERQPDRIYVTSLFTYAWRPVHQAVAFCKALYPQAPITLGGIYATLMRDHAERSGAEVFTGLSMDIEQLLPDYSLVPQFDTSLLFSSRGCIRRCPFCAAPILEPFDPGETGLKSISHLIEPSFRKVVFWDNNFLANPHCRDIVGELKERGLEVDFNQGIDARLITEAVAREFQGLKLQPIRMAYDTPSQKAPLERAASLLAEAGFDRRRMLIYLMYNYEDTPEEFLGRLREVLDLGLVAYPMRYEPIGAYDAEGNPLSKNSFISEYWSAEQLEMLARARRVIGYGGAFPPYEGLKKKIGNARTFEEAFALREPSRTKLRQELRKVLGSKVPRLPLMP